MRNICIQNDELLTNIAIVFIFDVTSEEEDNVFAIFSKIRKAEDGKFQLITTETN